MAIDWINDDMTFKPGFEANLPAELREVAKDTKDLPGAFKRIADTQRDFHSRVKIPEEPAERQKFMQEHFGKDLEARAAEKKKADDEAGAKLKTAQEAAAQEAARTRNANAENALKEKHGANFDTSLELVRRAFRSQHVPEWIKAGVAQAAGVEVDKLTDEHIKTVVKTDPAVFETLLKIGTLTQDGRTEHGDGHTNRTDEKKPSYPYSPEVYSTMPDSDPEKRWFIHRGAVYEDGKYMGGFGLPAK